MSKYIPTTIRRKKKIGSEKVMLIILSVIFALYSLTLFFPLVWIFVNSLREGTDFVFRQWEFTPISFENYGSLFGETNVGSMILNSLILALAIPTVNIFATACMAHAIASFKWRGQNIFYFLAISIMFIPTSGTLGITYKLMSDLGLMDTHIGIVLMSAGGMGFGFLMLYSVYKNISPTYSEAAFIDGAGYWRTFITVVTPQAKATLVALWILGFIGTWNDYAIPRLFLPSHKTLAVGIYELSVQAVNTGGTGYPQLFAAITVCIVPLLVLFFVFQKQIMQISVGGGIKE